MPSCFMNPVPEVKRAVGPAHSAVLGIGQRPRRRRPHRHRGDRRRGRPTRAGRARPRDRCGGPASGQPSDGVTAIEDRGACGASLAGFTRSALVPHTDRSSIGTPPGLLLTVCGREPSAGGESLLVDGRAVHDDLATTAPAALAALSTPRSVLFGGADGHLGSAFAESPTGVIAVRFRLDGLVRFAPAVWPHIPTMRAAIHRHTMTLVLRVGAGR